MNYDLEHKFNNRGSRALIASILVQAINDLSVLNPKTSEALKAKRSAKEFLSTESRLFCKYCDLIDVHPFSLEIAIKRARTSGKLQKLHKMLLAKKKDDNLPTE
jgi:hypothetical protein